LRSAPRDCTFIIYVHRQLAKRGRVGKANLEEKVRLELAHGPYSSLRRSPLLCSADEVMEIRAP
jgi:hypothetical protein